MNRSHPGFGAFAKSHAEFFDALASEGWKPVVGYQGVEEKILSGAFDHAKRITNIPDCTSSLAKLSLS